MAEYLTPGRYRTMALGVDLDERSDVELASLIAGATSELHRYCCAPQGHDYRGGTVEREEHLWDTGNSYYRPTGRLWPKHAAGVMPITSCTRVDIYTTITNYVRFEPAYIFVNSRLGYVEPIAAPMTTALFTSVPPWLLSSPVAYVDYSYGRTYKVKGERLYPSAGKAWRAVNQFWTDDDVTLTVDGVELTTGFTLDRYEGMVVFDELVAPNSTVELSYTHKISYDLALATGIIVTDMLGYGNINASGLGGLSGIKVEEIELRVSSKAGFANYAMHPAARPLLNGYTFVSMS